MTILAIFLTLTTIFFWWRGRVWKNRYFLALHPHVVAIVGEWSKLWADGFRDAQRTDAWPEEIERRGEDPDICEYCGKAVSDGPVHQSCARTWLDGFHKAGRDD